MWYLVIKAAISGVIVATVSELAKRYPHATWGPVEVREILFFDPV